MKEFLFLFRNENHGNNPQSPDAMQQNLEKWTEWLKQLTQEGKLNGGQPLENTGKVVSGTAKKITDGPFAEGKEIIGGYLLIKADSLDEAVSISKDCPIFENDGSVEVREIQQLHI